MGSGDRDFVDSRFHGIREINALLTFGSHGQVRDGNVGGSILEMQEQLVSRYRPEDHMGPQVFRLRSVLAIDVRLESAAAFIGEAPFHTLQYVKLSLGERHNHPNGAPLEYGVQISRSLLGLRRKRHNLGVRLCGNRWGSLLSSFGPRGSVLCSFDFGARTRANDGDDD